MSQALIQHIEQLVDHYLEEYTGGERIVFHCKLTIADICDDPVLGDVVYHDMPIEGGTYFEHTNIHKFIYENSADLKYVLATPEPETLPDITALSLSNHISTEIAVESEELGEWEFECFLTQINKEECGQFLFEAFGSKVHINFT